MTFNDYGRFQTVTKKQIALIDQAILVANTENPVLILGECGTGKKELAVFLHENSSRKNNSIINLSSQNFVLNQISNENTVVIENIENFTESQLNILFNFIMKSLKNNLKNCPRWIATASLDLPLKVKSGAFNIHLYHALSTNRLTTLDVNERSEDLLLLAEQHYNNLNEICKKDRRLSEYQKKYLLNRTYPRNFIDFYQALDELYTQNINYKNEVEVMGISKVQVGITLSEMEKKLIIQTLEMTHQNRTRAAEILGISIRTLRNKLNEYKAEVSHESTL